MAADLDRSPRLAFSRRPHPSSLRRSPRSTAAPSSTCCRLSSLLCFSSPKPSRGTSRRFSSRGSSPAARGRRPCPSSAARLQTCGAPTSEGRRWRGSRLPRLVVSAHFAHFLARVRPPRLTEPVPPRAQPRVSVPSCSATSCRRRVSAPSTGSCSPCPPPLPSASRSSSRRRARPSSSLARPPSSAERRATRGTCRGTILSAGASAR